MDYRISDSEYRFMQELWKQGLLDPESETELSDTFNTVSTIIATKSWEAMKATSDAEFERIVQEMITLATEAGYEECVEYTTNYLEMS